MYAAAVMIDARAIADLVVGPWAGLDDSKRLRPALRTRLAGAIFAHAVRVCIVQAAPQSIDRDGLHRTNIALLMRALQGAGEADLRLVDGFDLGTEAPPHRRLVGGDRTSLVVAAASVVAKVARDRQMANDAERAHPGYGFARHAGYATAAHREAIVAQGPSPLHRLSFRSDAYRGRGRADNA